MNSSRRQFIEFIALMSSAKFIDRSCLSSMSSEALLRDVPAGYPPLIHPPADPRQWPSFIDTLNAWRASEKNRLHYTGASYDAPAFQWASQNFSCCFLMIYDLDFFDRGRGMYTPEKIIARGEAEFGGYDSLVLWHAYPRIGIDDRNQFDFYRDMPGGLAGVRTVVKKFHDHHIRVFINYNPWDKGTRREDKKDVDALAEVIAAIDADGIFLDTLKEAGAEYRQKLDAVKKGVVLEGEFAADIENIPTNHLSWAQWFGDRYVPGILRNKWFERRHIQHQIARWDRDHTTELQQAWMNGSGIMVWENVFGQWLAWNERDKSILRAMIAIQRRFHRLFVSENWIPLVPTLARGTFAALWEVDGIRLWTIANRDDKEIRSEVLHIVHRQGDDYYDLVAGQKTTPSKNNDMVTIACSIGARSIACIVAANRRALGEDFEHFLEGIRSRVSHYSGSTSTTSLHPVITPVNRSVRTHRSDDMVEITPAVVSQRVEFVVREVGTYSSYMDLDVVSHLDDPYVIRRTATIPPIAIDRTPVTNAQYKAFLDASRYSPRNRSRFLDHWRDGAMPSGKENHPVVYVDLDDARAYAAWAGKRLPTECEWQFAAQGYDGLTYPWGNTFGDGYCNQTNSTTDVNAYPKGASPFGCHDMCGNTWEMTESEYTDKHNRFCILKGGSFFKAEGSGWYTSGGPQPSSHATKFLMMYAGLDRCATAGFRCVRDLD